MNMRVENQTDHTLLSLLSALAARSSAPVLPIETEESAGPRRVQASACPNPPKADQEREEKKKVEDVEEVRRRTGTRMRIDEVTRRIVAQIIDQNNEVIKQIPPQELLKIAARFRKLQGLLFDERV